MSQMIPGIISVDRGERSSKLISVGVTHFTDVIALNAIEYEDITGLLANKIYIRDVNIQCTSALAFRLWFWSTAGHANADLDVDGFEDFIELDMATNGEQIAGAGQYYYNDAGLNLMYEDEDGTFTLHCGLQIFAGAGKLAHPAEVVQIDIKHTPRL